MKLRLICENIKPRDFFDFYALLYAYQNTHISQLKDPSKHDVITKRLKEVINHIYDDHISQLTKIILDRILPFNLHVRKIAKQYGIKFRNPGADGAYKIINYNIQNLPGLLRDVIEYGKSSGKSFNFVTSGSGTWAKLAKELINLLNVGKDIKSKVMAIDKIYALAHHGGALSDYMDESSWLMDALNIRANATIGQLLAHASSDIKDLIGSAAYGIAQPEVSPIAKLATSIERASRSSKFDTININHNNQKIQILFTNEFGSFKATVVQLSLGETKYQSKYQFKISCKTPKGSVGFTNYGKNKNIKDNIIVTGDNFNHIAHNICRDLEGCVKPNTRMSGNRRPELEAELLQKGDPLKIWEYIANNFPRENSLNRHGVITPNLAKIRWPEAESILAKNPHSATAYACDILDSRWPEAESIILKEPYSAIRYAQEILKGPWPEAESIILKDPKTILRYTTEIKGRWPKAEPIILKAASTSEDDQIYPIPYWYAKNVIKNRWPEAEPIIAKHKDVMSWYKEWLKDRKSERDINRDLALVVHGDE